LQPCIYDKYFIKQQAERGGKPPQDFERGINMRKKSIKKLLRKAITAAGCLGAYLSSIMIIFNLFMTSKNAWASASERIAFDSVALLACFVSLVLLFVAAAINADIEKERKSKK
jgi:hypothetical protein